MLSISLTDKLAWIKALISLVLLTGLLGLVESFYKFILTYNTGWPNCEQIFLNEQIYIKIVPHDCYEKRSSFTVWYAHISQLQSEVYSHHYRKARHNNESDAHTYEP